MRYLGVDFGRRRVGLALSDDTALLARPWQTVGVAGTPGEIAARIATLIGETERDTDAADMGGIVVGLPRRLNGEETDLTADARSFAMALAAATGRPVHLQDERLSSHEADRRLAAREKDWRKRKAQVDAAAAAIILQDFLDGRPRAALE